MKFRQDVNGTTPTLKRILTNLKTVLRTAPQLYVPRNSSATLISMKGKSTHSALSRITGSCCAECGEDKGEMLPVYSNMGMKPWTYICRSCYANANSESYLD